MLAFVLIAGIHFMPDIVPDEEDFINYAQELSDKASLNIFSLTNFKGYGAAYWIFLVALFKMIGPKPLGVIACARVASLFCSFIVPFLIIKIGRDENRKDHLLIATLWLSFPMALWTGKLIGPELYCVALVLVGLIMVLEKLRFRGHQYVGFILLGFGLGIKINAIPVVVMAGLYVLFERSGFKRLAVFAFMLVCGFVIANPFVLFDPGAYLSTINSYRSPAFAYADSAGDILNHLRLIIHNHLYEWDLVLVGGLSQWGLHILLYPVLILLLIKSRIPWPLLCSYAACLALGLFMLLSNGRYLGWYWFPMIVPLPFVLLHAREFNKTTKSCLYVLVTLNLILNGPTILNGYKIKIKAVDQLRNLGEAQVFADKILQENIQRIDLIINESGFSEYSRIRINGNATRVTSLVRSEKEKYNVLYIFTDDLLSFSAYQERYAPVLNSDEVILDESHKHLRIVLASQTTPQLKAFDRGTSYITPKERREE